MKKIAILLVAGFTGLLLTQAACGAAEYQQYKKDLEAAENRIKDNHKKFEAIRAAGRLAVDASASNLINQMNEDWNKIQDILPKISMVEFNNKYRQGTRMRATVMQQWPGIFDWISSVEVKKNPDNPDGYVASLKGDIEGDEGELTTARTKKEIAVGRRDLVRDLSRIMDELRASSSAEAVEAVKDTVDLLKKISDLTEQPNTVDVLIQIEMWKKAGKKNLSYKTALNEILADLQHYVDSSALGKDLVQRTIDRYKKQLTDKGLLP